MERGDRIQADMASFKLAEFSDALDWRPMLFQEPFIAQSACVLCGVVYKKVIRLPCLHTLCTLCHTQSGHGGSVCPVDQKPFSGDDVQKLETPAEYILRRKVACWNAPRGCSFIGTAATLLDHYKECEFTIVPCCICRSSVIRSNILEHYKSGCNTHVDTCEPDDNRATQELPDVSRTCLEMKEAMRKISEDLMSLHTSLNRCSEDARAESARSKGQWDAQASRLNDLNTVCTTLVREELHVLQASMDDCKQHISEEFGLQREKLLPRHRKVHWYVEGWADLTKRASESGPVGLGSPTRVIHDYNVNQIMMLELTQSVLHVGSFFIINPGDNDSQLEWPFRKVYTVGVIHPKDHLNVISFRVDADQYKDQPCFQRPEEKGNTGLGTPRLTTVEKLETDGFVENDSLHLFLEIEP